MDTGNNIMRIAQLIISVLVAVGIIFLMLTGFLGNLFWFDSVGYSSVFLTILSTSVILGTIGTIFFFVISFFNIRFAARTGAGEFNPDLLPLKVCAIISAIFSLIAGLNIAYSWELVLIFLNQSSFSITDPVFGMDIGFYLFSLPFYTALIRYSLVLLIFTTILSTVSYFVQKTGTRIEPDGSFSIREPFFWSRWREFFRPFLFQLNILLFLIFGSLALLLWLSRYDLLYASHGAVYGVGYTEAMVTIPVLTILSIVAFIIGLCLLLNEKIRRPELILYGIGVFIAIAIIGLIVTALMQVFIVEPNEFNLEKPFIQNNVNSTLEAYGLDEILSKDFSVAYNLTGKEIAENGATISNIRLWDWRPLKKTYEQLQLFRTYYLFHDVDVDRYQLNGEYKEILLSAREMNVENLPQEAQTWVNQHLVYTHGYGAVMNPVDKITSNGLPEFYMKDIPPVSPYISLSEPRIYYGEGVSDYIITNTNTDEFDYPAGNQNMYTVYSGTGGIHLSFLNRIIYAVNFRSIELLMSGSVSPESRIHMKRNILDRVKTIAPFLSYDQDPYVVVADDHLYWIIDAYTTSNRYPYADPVSSNTIEGKSFNYIRNSVKVLIDAKDGNVSYYITEPSDPLLTTYSQIFPGLFKPIEDIPESLKQHLRYPHGLFNIQAEVYALYHMQDPRVFYNREDAWVIADEIYAQSRQQVEPYYIIMKLPGEKKEEFILMLPFTPRNKENLIGWMAARCDPEHYGELIVFKFSKQELTYGPMQIEAKIDQDTKISQDITLWSQAGSSVIRGNTLIIPIEHSLLYVEPLYLEATEKGTLPQLQRVIVSYNDRLTMEPTLSEAISDIFQMGKNSVVYQQPFEQQVTTDPLQILRQISGLYIQAQSALQSGELGRYQQYFDTIGNLAANTS